MGTPTWLFIILGVGAIVVLLVWTSFFWMMPLDEVREHWRGARGRDRALGICSMLIAILGFLIWWKSMLAGFIVMGIGWVGLDSYRRRVLEFRRKVANESGEAGDRDNILKPPDW